MKKTLSKGFTLIELLVVIAIIGILAGVVLTSLGTARDKAKNASAIASMSAMRSEAELAVEADGTYPADTLCSTSLDGLKDAIEGTLGAGHTVACFDTDNAWGASVLLLSNQGYYCVDSTGYSGTLTADPVLSDTNLSCL